MTVISKRMGASGRLKTKIIRARQAPLSWRLGWRLRPRYIWGWLAANFVAPMVSKLFPIMTATAVLRVRKHVLTDEERDEYLRLRLHLREQNADPLATKIALDVFRRQHGEWVDYGVVSHRVITNAGVAALVDDWDGNGDDISDFIYHGLGTDATAEAAGQTGLIAELTTQLNPNSTRAAGTQTQPASNQLRTTATLVFDEAATVEEHGLLDQSAVGGGTLWDRSLTGTHDMGVGESLQTEYTVTFNSGG